jgi:hypothetical protein
MFDVFCRVFVHMISSPIYKDQIVCNPLLFQIFSVVSPTTLTFYKKN